MRTILTLLVLAAAAAAAPYSRHDGYRAYDRSYDDYSYYRPYASRPWSYYRHLNPYRARYSYRFMVHHGYGLNAAQMPTYDPYVRTDYYVPGRYRLGGIFLEPRTPYFARCFNLGAIIGRLTTSFTLVDDTAVPELELPPIVDRDGLPRARANFVGSRFLVDVS